mmetsp:Transcript_108577/g.151726  ORF Transcript_108577/g.151726 Transcript_108577/m.151726 type:complete len:143 (-) Transcript_108577:1359-1787(-)
MRAMRAMPHAAHALESMEVAFQGDPRVDTLPRLPVLVLEGLGVLDHLLDLFLRRSVLVLDRDLLAAARALILGGDAEDAIAVDLEGHLDLRLSPQRWGDTKLELAKQTVVLGHGAFAFEYLDVHCWLVVPGGREDLGFARWD